METITKVVSTVGAADIDERLEILLIDGIIYAFQEQTVEDNVMLDGFGTVVNALGESSLLLLSPSLLSTLHSDLLFSTVSSGIRVKPYLTQIVSTILWRLNNKSAKVRQQAADLTTRLAVVIKQCGEDAHLSKVSITLRHI